MGLTFAGLISDARLTLGLLLEWAFGIVFQYSAIVPMRGLSFGTGLLQAIRAGTLAIIAFEIGLFWLDDVTLAHLLFPHPHLRPVEANLLVPDVDWSDWRLLHFISRQHLSSQVRLEGKDAAV